MKTAVAKIKTHIGPVFNEAYLILKERENQRVRANKDQHDITTKDYEKWLELEEGDPTPEPKIIELKPYEEPTTQEIISTALAIMSKDQHINRIWSIPAEILRPIASEIQIEASLEESDTEYNDTYPEQTIASYTVKVAFPEVIEIEELGEDNKPIILPTKKTKKKKYNREKDVLEALNSTGFEWLLE